MTEEESRADVDAAVDEFSELVAGQQGETRGVRPPPRIEESEAELGLEPFGFGLVDEPIASAAGTEGGIGPPIIITYPPTGACCRSGTSDCSVTQEDECGSGGGHWQGGGTDCSDVDCEDVLSHGACCIDGVCFGHFTEADCISAGGTWQGEASWCSPTTLCPTTGACCNLPARTCTITTELACVGEGFVFKGIGTVCTPDPCHGACCYAGAACGMFTADECSSNGGTFLGYGTPCPVEEGDTCCEILGHFNCCIHPPEHDPDCGCQCCVPPYTELCSCCFYGWYHACCCFNNPPYGYFCSP